MNEQDLKLKIAGLEKAIKEHDDFSATYQNDLKSTQKLLDDYNKPELTLKQLEAIEDAVEQAVSEFDFTDTENFEIDYSLDYDGRVQCESHEFINDCDLVEMIVSRVYSLFKEADCPEELDTTEPDNHPVERLQN